MISSASIRSLLFRAFIVPNFGLNVPFIFPIFLKRFLVLPFLLLPSISLYCSFKKAFLSLLAILWNSAFSWLYHSHSPLLFPFHLSSAIFKASSDNHFAFSHFFFFVIFLFAAPVQYYGCLFTVLQVLCLLVSLESIHHLHCIFFLLLTNP